MIEGVRWSWSRIDAGGPTEAGRRAALGALAQLGAGLSLAYDGTRPIVAGGAATISISHGRVWAVAVAAPPQLGPLGVDVCELDRAARIRNLAARYFTADEREAISTDRDAVALWAAKEAGLKALGHGLLDGGAFDDPDRGPVQVRSLAPPAFAVPSGFTLSLAVRDDLIVALARGPNHRADGSLGRSER